MVKPEHFWMFSMLFLHPRPDHPTEKGRIEAAGGSVSFEVAGGKATWGSPGTVVEK